MMLSSPTEHAHWFGEPFSASSTSSSVNSSGSSTSSNASEVTNNNNNNSYEISASTGLYSQPQQPQCSETTLLGDQQATPSQSNLFRPFHIRDGASIDNEGKDNKVRNPSL